MQIITTMKTGGIFIIAVILSLSIQAQTAVTEGEGDCSHNYFQSVQGRERVGGFYFDGYHPRPLSQ